MGKTRTRQGRTERATAALSHDANALEDWERGYGVRNGIMTKVASAVDAALAGGFTQARMERLIDLVSRETVRVYAMSAEDVREIGLEEAETDAVLEGYSDEELDGVPVVTKRVRDGYRA